MYRLTIFAFLLAPLLVGAGQSKPSAFVVLNISLYAPVQSDAPVRIVGFEHGQSEIQFVLSNSSDKPVVGVIIDRVDIAPPGCAEPRNGMDRGVRSLSGAGFELRIVPHGKVIASRAGVFQLEHEPPQNAPYPHLTGATPQNAVPPHYPKSVVLSARNAGAGYVQAQFGVTGVYFEDGSTWPSKIDPRYRPDPFDSALVESEIGRCTDFATVASALQSVEEVVFEKETPVIADKSEVNETPPHLHFSCSLEGAKAVCRLPLEKGRAIPQAQSKARGQE